MTIKDFNPGQTVYLLSRKRESGKLIHHSITRCVVLSVGRKYVRAVREGHEYPTVFCKAADTDEFLSESAVWGEKAKLFLTEAAANDDIEKEMLCGWLRKATYNTEIYTVEQLREVRKILEE